MRSRENPAPLTIEELRQMDEEPVWVSNLKEPESSEYCVTFANYSVAYIPGCECDWYSFETYGKTWIAYRHKPKEEVKHE